ncbi:HK97 family phage prohead protease [Hyphococcus sp.]|uniref:HK97 family phage prohead protease n=1 Tax=Hyphococcus sp. TaxID=2038636 RepID=UPI002083F592|nr:MAG: hypothetical protein DHS20C04_24300 [Marinicaulis sp.]
MTTLIASIEGYASVFNTPDLNGDIVAPGAFAKSLRKNPKPAMLYSHAAEAPIGRWISIREDGYGLFVKGELLLSSPRAREVHALLEGGAIDGLSIGYQTARSIRVKAGRRITEAELWEVSVVTFPMAPQARVTRVGPARPDYEPQDYAKLFHQSARVSSSHVPNETRATRRALVLPPPAQGTSARHLADAVKCAAQRLTA